MRTDCPFLLPLTEKLLQKVVFTQSLHFVTLASTIFYHLTHTSTTGHSQESREEFGQTSGPTRPSATFCMWVSLFLLSCCSLTFPRFFWSMWKEHGCPQAPIFTSYHLCSIYLLRQTEVPGQVRCPYSGHLAEGSVLMWYRKWLLQLQLCG